MTPPCDSTTCAELALYRVHWPGKTVYLCQACTDRARRLAAFMGFELTTDPIASPLRRGELARVGDLCPVELVSRRPYSKPTLRRYGTIADITRAVGHASQNLDGGQGKGMSRTG